MREGPDFVFWFMKIGIAVVLAGLGISALLFVWLRRWSHKQAAMLDEKAGTGRRPRER